MASLVAWLVWRGLGSGVKVLWQSLQRQRAVPPRLVPCLTTAPGLWQKGQRMAWVIMPNVPGKNHASINAVKDITLNDAEFWTFSATDGTAKRPTRGFVRVRQDTDFVSA